MTTTGKYRHLDHCSTDAGHFVMLAIDHRTNLLEPLNKYAKSPLTDAEFVAFKQEVISALSLEISALLTDPAYGIGAGIASRAIRGPVGLLAPLEMTDYNLHPSQRAIDFIPNWSVEKIKRIGGDGVKLLLPYHPDADNAQDNRDTVERVAEECARYDIPFFLEPIAYSLNPNQALSNTELRQVVVDMAKVFSAMNVDVLKMQFPVDPVESDDESEWHSACDEVNHACRTPWAILSGGVDFTTFTRQARIACQSGASGVIVGRALWTEAVSLHGPERATFMTGVMPTRMRELAHICKTFGKPWFERTTAPDASPNWYETL